MRIIPLSEGSFTVDKTKSFLPFDESKDLLRERSSGSLLVEVQPFLVITSQDVLLFDTGLGFTGSNGVLQIHQNIMNAGINPGEITKVMMSHLHKDHSGGISMNGIQNGHSKLSFANATYYIQKGELNYAFNEGAASYIQDDLECLKDSQQMELIEGNGMIGDYITYEMTAAHTPFHQVFSVAEGEDKLFFGGDDAPQLSQMKNRYVAKYDFNGKKCMELRQEWWKKGVEQEWTFLFYHDIKTPTVKRSKE